MACTLGCPKEIKAAPDTTPLGNQKHLVQNYSPSILPPGVNSSHLVDPTGYDATPDKVPSTNTWSYGVQGGGIKKQHQRDKKMWRIRKFGQQNQQQFRPQNLQFIPNNPQYSGAVTLTGQQAYQFLQSQSSPMNMQMQPQNVLQNPHPAHG